ncbi:MAG: hypothetical protein WCP73_02780 [Eubacteriales bacterium]
MGSFNSEIENNLEENRSVFSSGWKQNEIELLKEEIRKADAEGRPLKNVFDNIAKLTGRKPNSIRNFYYIQAKKENSIKGRVCSFVSFSENETVDLVKFILMSMAKGKSVRSCAFELGGDKKGMLRYQNKYRSVIKNSTDMVKKIMQDLENEKIEYVNPYQDRSTQKKPINLYDEFLNAIDELYNVNKMFLGLSPMNKIAELPSYISELTEKVSRVEKYI